MDKKWGGALLVAGTCIGGGMLGLPVLTGLGGFLPAVALYLICWSFMALTGFLYFESCLWFDGSPNIISLSKKTLGWPGQVFSWGVYLFLFYALMTAYITGCAELLSRFSLDVLSPSYAAWVFVLIVAPIVYLGASAVDRVNKFAMIGLIAGFLLFFFLGLNKINWVHYRTLEWKHTIKGLPIAFTAFAFQGIIPSLSSYLHRDVKKLKFSVLTGTGLALLVYIVWGWLVMGIVPTYGEGGLHEAASKGQNAVVALKEALNNPWIFSIGALFAFFALMTSLLGVSLGLIDFLADGLKVEKKGIKKVILTFLVFLPPFLISQSNPLLFLKALNWAGGYGCALLLGVLPILIVWAGRYIHNFTGKYRVMGGRVLLGALLIFTLFEIAVEMFVN